MKVATLCVGLAFAVFAPLAHADLCFSKKKILEIKVGYVGSGSSMGPDYGDAVYFLVEGNRFYPLAHRYNLDWPRGERLLRVLMVAMDGGLRVSGHDHHGTRCDDIDELRIEF